MMTDLFPGGFVCDVGPVERRALVDRILQGVSIKQVAQERHMSVGQIATILHEVCLHANPDLYCDTVKATVKREPWRQSLAGCRPSLTFLRQHRVAFGCTREE